MPFAINKIPPNSAGHPDEFPADLEVFQGKRLPTYGYRREERAGGRPKKEREEQVKEVRLRSYCDLYQYVHFNERTERGRRLKAQLEETKAGAKKVKAETGKKKDAEKNAKTAETDIQRRLAKAQEKKKAKSGPKKKRGNPGLTRQKDWLRKARDLGYGM